MATTTTNQQFTISLKDVARGVLLAIVGAVLTFLQGVWATGQVVFDWEQIGSVALIAGVSYLIKNFFTPSEIVIVDPPKDDLQAVKKGSANVKVTK